jgi:hypothetical protein
MAVVWPYEIGPRILATAMLYPKLARVRTQSAVA